MLLTKLKEQDHRAAIMESIGKVQFMPGRRPRNLAGRQVRAAIARLLILNVTLLAFVSRGNATTGFDVLYDFSGGNSNSGSGLAADKSGALYGTSIPQGAPGMVYKLTPPATPGGSWTESVLWSFTGGSDGSLPDAGLLTDRGHTLWTRPLHSVFEGTP